MDASWLLRAEERWGEILAERPDLEPALVLQRALVSRLIATSDTMGSRSLPELEFPARYLTLKLARGIPLLSGERLPVPVPLLAPLLLAFAGDLAAGGAGAAAARVGQVIESGRIEPESLLAASLARDQQAVRTAATQLGLSADLLWLIAELAVSPFAHAVATLLTESLRSDDADGEGFASGGLSVWDRGYCPACGCWPVLAELTRHGRLLGCSFCATTWQSPHRCVYCTEAGEAFSLVAPDAEKPDRMIEVCRACGGYLKAARFDDAIRFPLLAIEDLATVDLDHAALELGFGRPPMPSSYPA